MPRSTARLSLTKFPIPMRGNELSFNVGVTVRPFEFPIPMRGNEPSWWAVRVMAACMVSDPHEG